MSQDALVTITVMKGERLVYMIYLTGSTLSISYIHAVARQMEQVSSYSPEVVALMNESYQWIVNTIEHNVALIYGVNTGFGSLARERIAPDTKHLSSAWK
jgi:histidine ammonia-lyase